MRLVICPVCASKTRTTEQQDFEGTQEVVQSHWNTDNDICEYSLQPAIPDLASWEMVEELSPLEAKVQELTEVVDQLILDQLMGDL